MVYDFDILYILGSLLCSLHTLQAKFWVFYSFCWCVHSKILLKESLTSFPLWCSVPSVVQWFKVFNHLQVFNFIYFLILLCSMFTKKRLIMAVLLLCTCMSLALCPCNSVHLIKCFVSMEGCMFKLTNNSECSVLFRLIDMKPFCLFGYINDVLWQIRFVIFIFNVLISYF